MKIMISLVTRGGRAIIEHMSLFYKTKVVATPMPNEPPPFLATYMLQDEQLNIQKI